MYFSKPVCHSHKYNVHYQFKLYLRMTLTAIKYDSSSSTLSLLDQRLLPSQIKYVQCSTAAEVKKDLNLKDIH